MPLLILWVVLNIAWLLAIIDASRHPVEAFEAGRRSKGATVVLVVATGWLGAAYYGAVIRPALLGAARSPSGTSADDDTQYCLDCDMTRFPAEAERCTNCGSQRLAPSSARRRRR